MKLEDLIWGVKSKTNGDYLVARTGTHSIWSDELEMAKPFDTKLDAYNAMAGNTSLQIFAFVEPGVIRTELSITELIELVHKSEGAPQ